MEFTEATEKHLFEHYFTGLRNNPGEAVLDANGNLVWSGDRPPFIYLTTKLFSRPGIDRCHSVSWECLCAVVLDILNRGVGHGEEVGKALNYLTEVFSRGINRIRFPDYDEARRYNRLLGGACFRLISAYKKMNIEEICVNTTEYLKILNSSIGNLRYPYSCEYNWNQSVSSAYDPNIWYYVESGRVKSAYWNLDCDRPYTDCLFWWGRPAPIGDGFYLVGEIDGYLLESLYDPRITQFLSKTHVFFYMGHTRGGQKLLASSQNAYKIETLGGFQAPVYYLDSTGNWRQT